MSLAEHGDHATAGVNKILHNYNLSENMSSHLSSHASHTLSMKNRSDVELNAHLQ